MLPRWQPRPLGLGARGMSAHVGYAVYGSWVPNTPEDFAECERDPYITPAGVVPEWVTALHAAGAECQAGHPAGLTGRQFCGFQRCGGVR
jgi:hypothetical protein